LALASARTARKNNPELDIRIGLRIELEEWIDDRPVLAHIGEANAYR
jgi:hypothetical protein